MSFPSSPLDGQSVVVNNILYTFNSSKQTWTRVPGNTILGGATYEYANVIFNNANSAYSKANSAGLYANSAFIKANNAYTQATTATTNASVADIRAISAGSYANSAFAVANSAYIVATRAEDSAVTTASYANSAYTQANTSTQDAASASLYANAAFEKSNTATTAAATADSKAVSAGSYANSAYTRANSATTAAATADSKAVSAGSYANSSYTQSNTATTNALAASTYANGAFLQSNTAITNASIADDKAVTSGSYANSAFNQANTSTINAATADGKAVTAGSYANSAYTAANTSDNKAISAGSYANSAFSKANNALANTTGTFNGDLTLTGKLTASATGGDEGGEILLGKAVTNTTLVGNGVTIDVWQNKLRIFEEGGTNRGVYIDITSAATTVGTNLLNPAATPDTVARETANTAVNNAASASLYANAAFLAANAAGSSATVTSAFLQANSAFASSNATSLRTDGAFIQANAAFIAANIGKTFVQSGGTINGSVTISQDLNVTGNIVIGGNSTSISSNNLTLTDSLLYLANGNSGNTVDIGIVGSFVQGRYQHTGVVRDHLDGRWKFVSNVVAEPTTTVDFANAQYDIIKSGGLETVGSINIGTVAFVGSNAGSALGGATNPIIGSLGSSSGYIQTYIYNTANGTSSSADLVAYPNNGTDSAGWIDMGITSNNFTDATFNVTGRNEGYVFMSAPNGVGTSGNLIFATDSTGVHNAVEIYTGGFAQGKTNPALLINNNKVKTTKPIAFVDNTLQNTAAAPYAYTNASFTTANSALDSATSAGSYANAAFAKANAASGSASSGYTANNVIVANSAGYLSGTSNLQFLQSNNTLIVSGNVLATNFFGPPSTNTSISANGFITTFDTTGVLSLPGAIRFSDGSSQNTAFNGFAIDNVARYTSTSAEVYANGAFIQANTGVTNAATADSKAVGAGLYANGAFLQANSAFNNAAGASQYANSAFNYANSSFTQANSAVTNALAASTYANSAYVQANTGVTNAATADSKAVSAGSYANSAYTQANTATTDSATADSKAVSAGSYANSAFLVANTASSTATSGALYANGAFIQANTAVNNASGASLYANASFNYANSAYVQANTGVTNASVADSKAVTAGEYANSAFTVANTAISNAAGASLYANAAFLAANNAGSSAAVVAAFLQANSAFTHANAAYAQANTGGGGGGTTDTYARDTANAAFIQANAAFVAANTGVGGGGSGATNLNLVADTFTGDGANVSFVLSQVPTNVDYLIVNVNGVLQLTTAYSLSGATISFTEAPASGVKIDVKSFKNGTGIYTTRSTVGDGSEVNYTVTNGTDAHNVIVTENGVVQTPIADYTISGPVLTFNTAPVSGVKVQIRELGVAISADTYSRENSNAAFAKANTGTTLGKSIAMTIVFGG